MVQFALLCELNWVCIHDWQGCRSLLEDDTFLQSPESEEPFTNSTLHKVLAGVGVSNTEVTVAKLAFIVTKMVEVLVARIPGKALPESSTFQPGATEHAAYDRALSFVRSHAGIHWATHASSQPGAEPIATSLRIVLPKEVWNNWLACSFVCSLTRCFIVGFNLYHHSLLFTNSVV